MAFAPRERPRRIHNRSFLFIHVLRCISECPELPLAAIGGVIVRILRNPLAVRSLVFRLPESTPLCDPRRGFVLSTPLYPQAPPLPSLLHRLEISNGILCTLSFLTENLLDLDTPPAVIRSPPFPAL